MDAADRIVTVKKPVESTVVCFPHALETLRSLKMSKDSIVGLAKHRPEYDPVMIWMLAIHQSLRKQEQRL